jgi:hypothetical protein
MGATPAAGPADPDGPDSGGEPDLPPPHPASPTASVDIAMHANECCIRLDMSIRDYLPAGCTTLQR